MMADVEIKPKKFLVIPRDFFELLQRRFASQEEAIDSASDTVAEGGQPCYVAELQIAVTQPDRPVKVRKL